MNSKEIEEGNLSIALFMGAVEMSSSIWSGIKTINSIAFKTNKEYGNMFHDSIRDFSELKYHSDWNKLMSVIEKIESILPDGYTEISGEFTNHLYSTTICIDYREDLATRVPILVQSRVSRIESAYQAVIQFINWYNQPNK